MRRFQRPDAFDKTTFRGDLSAARAAAPQGRFDRAASASCRAPLHCPTTAARRNSAPAPRPRRKSRNAPGHRSRRACPTRPRPRRRHRPTASPTPDRAAPLAAGSQGRTGLAGGSTPRARAVRRRAGTAASLSHRRAARRSIDRPPAERPATRSNCPDQRTSPRRCRGSSSRPGGKPGSPRAPRPRRDRSSGCAVRRTPSRLRGATSGRRAPPDRARARHRPDRRKSPAASDSLAPRRRAYIAPTARRTASYRPHSAPNCRRPRPAFSRRLRRRREASPPAPAPRGSPPPIEKAPRGSLPRPPRFGLCRHFTIRSASSIVPPPISRSSLYRIRTGPLSFAATSPGTRSETLRLLTSE